MGEVFAARYELVDPIGHGGVGAVWRAWDRRRRRYVAAKVLQQSDAHALLRFVREQALRIDHPHVLAPASWAADDDKVLFTMDLVAGGSLVHLVNDYGPLPPGFVCTLLDQLLAGLAAVHAEGVVHRDIKPANVLLEATGTARPRLRLSDFGIAMRLGEPRLTETNYVVGTPGYFAPEQMMGAEPDFPADLFAVGLVALYLLEGAKPDAKALIEYFAENGTPPAPQGIPDPLWQVVATLLQPDPDARFRTATGARKALSSAAELLPEPGPDDELVEVFDQVGPLPAGFGPTGPLGAAPHTTAELTAPWPEGLSGPPSGQSPTPLAGPARGQDPASPPGPASGQDPTPLPGTPSGQNPASLPGPASGRSPTADPGPASAQDPVSGSGPIPGWGPAPGSDGGTGSGRHGTGPWHPLHGTVPQEPGSGGAWPETTSGGVRREPGSQEGVRSGAAFGDVRPEAAPGAVRHEAAPGDVPPRPAPDAVPPQPSTMSDTGSFHLPPPLEAGPHARPEPPPQPQSRPRPAPPQQPPAQHAWHETQQQPVPRRPQRPPEQPPTPPTAVALPATAPVFTRPLDHGPTPVPSPQRPTEPTVATRHHTYAPTVSHRAPSRRAARPGPPAWIAVPVLLLALACLAVGFWALTQI